MCLFCKIAAGEIPSKKAYEDESVYAFYDIAPQAPVHILVIPKVHIESAQALTREDDALLGHMFEVARQIAAGNGLDKTGYRL
ncbi:MAG: HIT domain-containing protein, partial [Clostridia bacterium]|nr:HIT domain-containing protein [Clostridia bacterium]